jgi:type IV pilus assembly protein PilB
MGRVNTRRHIGDILLGKGVISEDQLQMALAILNEEPENSSRRLGQILYQDLKLDRHTVMKEIAAIYAFDEVFEGFDHLPPEKISDIKEYVDDLPQEVVDDLVYHKAVPVHKTNSTLTIAAADPADPELSTIISKLSFKQFEIAYCRYELVEKILGKVYEQKNEFLDLLEDIEYEEAEIPEGNEGPMKKRSMRRSTRVCSIPLSRGCWLKVYARV